MKQFKHLIGWMAGCWMMVFGLGLNGLTAQFTPVDLGNQKFEWMIEHKTMTRAEMQAILDKPAAERVIVLKVMVRVPRVTPFTDKRVVLNDGRMDFTIRDKDGNPFPHNDMVVRHIPGMNGTIPDLSHTSAVEGALGETASTQWAGMFEAGSLSVTQGIEMTACGGGTFAANNNFYGFGQKGNIFDTVIAVAFYLNKLGSFYVDFKSCNQNDCPPSTSRPCPGVWVKELQLGIRNGNNLINSTSGESGNVINFMTYHNAWDLDMNLTDATLPLQTYSNHYHTFKTGGVTLLEGPVDQLVLADTACPGEDFNFSVRSESPGSALQSLEVQYLPEGANAVTGWQTLVNFGASSFTFSSQGGISAVGTPVYPIGHTYASSAPYVQEFKIAGASLSKYAGAQLRVIGRNSSGVDTNRINYGSPDGVFHANSTKIAVLRVPKLPSFKLEFTPLPASSSPNTWRSYGNNPIAFSGGAARLRITDSLPGIPTPPGNAYTGSRANTSDINTSFWDVTDPSAPVSVSTSNGWSADVTVNGPTNYVAHPKFWQYGCEGASDTIKIVTSMSVSLTAGKVFCQNSGDYGTNNELTVFFNSLGALNPDYTMNTGLKLERIDPANGNVSGITIKTLTCSGSGVCNTSGLLKLTLDETEVAKLFNNDFLRVGMKDPNSGDWVYDTVLISVGSDPVDNPAYNIAGIMAFKPAAQNGEVNECNGEPMSNAFGRQYELRMQGKVAGLPSSLTSLSQDMNTFYANYTVKSSNAQCGTPNKIEGTFSSPSYSFVADEFNNFTIEAVTYEGCSFTYGPYSFNTEVEDVTPVITNLYGEGVVCNDTLYLSASIPQSKADADFAVGKGGWNWYFHSGDGFFGYEDTYLYDLGGNGTQIQCDANDYTPSYGTQGVTTNSRIPCDELYYYMENTVMSADIYVESFASGRDGIYFEITGREPGSAISTIKIWGDMAMLLDLASLFSMPVLPVYGTEQFEDQMSNSYTFNFEYEDSKIKFPNLPTLYIKPSENSVYVSSGQDTIITSNNQTIADAETGRTVYNDYLEASGYGECALSGGNDVYLRNWQKSSNGGVSWQTITELQEESVNNFRTPTVGDLDYSVQYRILYQLCYAPTCMPRPTNAVTVNLKAAEQVGDIYIPGEDNEPTAMDNAQLSVVTICGPKNVNIIPKGNASALTHYRYEYSHNQTTWIGFQHNSTTSIGSSDFTPAPISGIVLHQNLLSYGNGSDTVYVRAIGRNISKNPVFLDTSAVVKIVKNQAPTLEYIKVNALATDTACDNETVALEAKFAASFVAGTTYKFSHTAYILNNLPAATLSGDKFSLTTTLPSGNPTWVFARAEMTNGCWDTAVVRVVVYDTAKPVVKQQGDSCWFNPRAIAVQSVSPYTLSQCTYQWYSTPPTTLSNDGTFSGTTTSQLQKTALSAKPASPITDYYWVYVTREVAPGYTCVARVRAPMKTDNCPVAKPSAEFPITEHGTSMQWDSVCSITQDVTIKLRTFSTSNDVRLWLKGSPNVDLTTDEGYAYSYSDSTFTIPASYFTNPTQAKQYQFFVTTSDLTNPSDALYYSIVGYPSAGVPAYSPVVSDTLCMDEQLTVNMTPSAPSNTEYERTKSGFNGNNLVSGSPTAKTVALTAANNWASGDDSIRVVYKRLKALSSYCYDTAFYRVHIKALPTPGSIVIVDSCQYRTFKAYSTGHESGGTILWHGNNGNPMTSGTVTAGSGFSNAVDMNVDTLTVPPTWSTGGTLNIGIKVVARGCTTALVTRSFSVGGAGCVLPTLDAEPGSICEDTDSIGIENIQGTVNSWRLVKAGKTDTATLTVGTDIVISGDGFSAKIPYTFFSSRSTWNTPSVAGNYTLTITDGPSIKHKTFTIYALPSTPVIGKADSACVGGDVALQASSTASGAVTLSFYSTHFQTSPQKVLGASGSMLEVNPLTNHLPAGNAYRYHVYAEYTPVAGLTCSSRDSADSVFVIKPIPAKPDIELLRSRICVSDTADFQVVSMPAPTSSDVVSWFITSTNAPIAVQRKNDTAFRWKPTGPGTFYIAARITSSGCPSLNSDTVELKVDAAGTINPVIGNINTGNGFCPDGVLNDLTATSIPTGTNSPTNIEWWQGNKDKTVWTRLGLSSPAATTAAAANQRFKDNKPTITDTTWFALVEFFGACPAMSDTQMIAIFPRPDIDDATVEGDTVCQGSPFVLKAGVSTNLANTRVFFTITGGAYLGDGVVTSTTPASITMGATSTYATNPNTYNFSVYAVSGQGCHSDTTDGHTFVVNAKPVINTIEQDTTCIFAPLKVYVDKAGSTFDSIRWYSVSNGPVINTNDQPAGFAEKTIVVGDTLTFKSPWMTIMSNPGSATASLIARAYKGGCYSEKAATINGVVGGDCVPPTVEFTTNGEICDTSDMVFSNIIGGNPSKWEIAKQISGSWTAMQDITSTVTSSVTGDSTLLSYAQLGAIAAFKNPTLRGYYQIRLTIGAYTATNFININAIPTVPVFGKLDSACEGSDVILRASSTTATSVAPTLVFYSTDFATSPVENTGSSGSVVSVTPSTSHLNAGNNYRFYVYSKVKYTTGLGEATCISDTIDSVFVIKDRPAAPTIPFLDSICEGDTAVLKLSADPGSGITVNWMNNNVPLSPLVKVDNQTYKYKTPSGNTPLNITASLVQNGCIGDTSTPAVKLTIKQKGTKPVINGKYELCAGGTINALTTNAIAQATAYQWRFKTKTDAWDDFIAVQQTAPDANTAFATENTSRGEYLTDTVWFALVDSFSVCPPISSDTVMIIVRQQPTGPISLTPNNTAASCKDGLMGEIIELDGLNGLADTVNWYMLGHATAFQEMLLPSGSKTLHNNLLGKPKDTLDIGVTVPATPAYYTLRAVAGVKLGTPGYTIATDHGCVALVSDSTTVQVQPKTKMGSNIKLNRIAVCTGDSVVASIEKATTDQFDYAIWYYSTYSNSRPDTIGLETQTKWTKFGDTVWFAPKTAGKLTDTAVFKNTTPPTAQTKFHVMVLVGARDAGDICGSRLAAYAEVNVDRPAVGGTISPTDTFVCVGAGNPMMQLVGAVASGPSYQWYDSIAGSGVVNTIAGSTSTTLVPDQFTVAQKTFVWATVQSAIGVCPPTRSAMAIVDTFAHAVAGTLTVDSLAACAGNSIKLDSAKAGEVISHVKTIVWQYTHNPNGTWTTISNPSTNNPPQNVPAMADGDTGYYRAIVFNSNAVISNILTTKCPRDTTNVVKVRWDKPVSGSTVTYDGANPTCEREVKLTYTHGSAQPKNFQLLTWRYKEGSLAKTDYGAGDGDLDTTVNASLTPPAVNANFIFYALVQNGVCAPQEIASTVLTVKKAPQRALIATRSQDTICSSAPGGADTKNTTQFTLSGTGVGTIQWQRSTDQSTWENLGSTNTSITLGATQLQEPVANLDTLYYIRAQFGDPSDLSCPVAYSDTFTVTVMATPTIAGQINALDPSLCVTSDSIYVYSGFSKIVGYTQWYEKIPGGTLIPVGNQGVNAIVPYTRPAALDTGTYSYRIYVSNSRFCNPAYTSDRLIRVWDTVRAGEVTPLDNTVCQNTAVSFLVSGNNYGRESKPALQPQWLVRVPPATNWTTLSTNNSDIESYTMSSIQVGTTPLREITYALGNPGCDPDTANVVTLKVTSGVPKPVLAPIEVNVCIDSAIQLKINPAGFGVADSLEILLGGIHYAYVPITSDNMTYNTNKLSTIGQNEFEVRNFVAGKSDASNGCFAQTSQGRTVTVNDSSKAGRLTHTAPAASDTTKSIVKGSTTGIMQLNGGLYTTTGVILSGQNQIIVGGVGGSMNTQAGWSAGLPGHYGLNPVSDILGTFDTVRFRAVITNPGCPADTSNWVWIYLKESDSIVTTATPTPVCMDGGTSTVSAVVPSAFSINDEYWERIFYPENGSAPVVTARYKEKVNLTNHAFTETYTPSTSNAGTYVYIYHYELTNDMGNWKVVTDSAAKVRVDTLSIAGTIQANFDRLCEDSVAPMLTLNGHIGKVLGWEFAPSPLYAYQTKTSADVAQYQVVNKPTDSGYYRASVQNGVCPPAYTPTILVQVYSKTQPGIVEHDPLVPCFLGPTTLTVTGHTGTVYAWAYKDQYNMVDTILQPEATNPYTWGMVDGKLQIRALVRNSAYCGITATPIITIYSKDTLIIDRTTPLQTCVFADEPSISWTISAAGFEPTSSLYTTIPQTDIEYQWYIRLAPTSAWIPITNPNTYDISGSTSAAITIPATHYQQPVYEHAEYMVEARQKASTGCTDNDTLYVGEICVNAVLSLCSPDPRCIVLDSVAVIEPSCINGQPISYAWQWTASGGSTTTLTCSGSPSWLISGCTTSMLEIRGDQSLQGSILSVIAEDAIGTKDTVSYNVCLDSMPNIALLENDTVCENSPAEFALDYSVATRPDGSTKPELILEWFRITGTDTLAITLSKAQGSAKRPDGSNATLQGGEDLAKYQIGNDLNTPSLPSILRYTGAPSSMDGFRYAVRISSPKTVQGVRIEPPLWIAANLIVVSPIQLHANYPEDVMLCNLNTATLQDSVIKDQRFHDIQWYEFNPSSTNFDAIPAATGSTYTTPKLVENTVYQYKYSATNICGMQESRVATVTVRALPEIGIETAKPIILCENDVLKIDAKSLNPDPSDSVQWFVNGTWISTSGLFVEFPDKTGWNSGGTGGTPYPKNPIRRPFVFTNDSLMMGGSWNDPVLADANMDSIMFTVRIANKTCTDNNGWISDSILLRVNKIPIFNSPGDQTVYYSSGTTPTVEFSFESNGDPMNQYQWYWTQSTKPTDLSYDQLVNLFGNKAIDDNRPLHLHSTESNAVSSMVAIGAVSGIEPDGDVLRVTVSDPFTFDSLMFACQVSSNTCGTRTDTTLFARLRIIQMEEPCPEVGLKEVSMCTDNVNTMDNTTLVLSELVKPSGTPSLQWYYWDGNPDDQSWRKLDPRQYGNTRSDTAIFLPVKAYANKFYFNCLINNRCWSDTIVAVINLKPKFNAQPYPLRSRNSFVIWEELDQIPTVCPAVDPRPLRLGELGGFARPFDTNAVKEMYVPGTAESDQVNGNVIRYEWFRAERGSNTFVSTQSPIPGNAANSTWTLCDMQTNAADDSIRVAVRIYNDIGCEGENMDTILILVPKCKIDSLGMTPAAICNDDQVVITAYPETDQIYTWYRRDKNGQNQMVIKPSEDSRFSINGHKLTIQGDLQSLDSAEFNCQVVHVAAGCVLFEDNWKRLVMEKAPDPVTINSSAFQAGKTKDTLMITETDVPPTVWLTPTNSTPGYTYEWHVVKASGVDTVIGISTNHATEPPYNFKINFDLELNEGRLYAKVFTPNGCDSSESNQVILKFFRQFKVNIKTPVVYCEDAGVKFEAETSPENAVVTRWEWQYKQPGQTEWTIINAGTNGVLGTPIQTWTTGTLQFRTMGAALQRSSFRVIAVTQAGSDTALPVTVEVGQSVAENEGYLTRSPQMNSVVCVPSTGTTVTYTAHAYVYDGSGGTQPATSGIIYYWNIYKPNGNVLSFADQNPIDLNITDIEEWNNTVVVCQAGVEGCEGFKQVALEDTLKLQSTDSIKISVDTSTLCSSLPIKFSVNHDFSAFVTWSAPTGSPTVGVNVRDFYTTLPIGKQKVYVTVQAMNGIGCEATDSIEVDIKGGTPIDVYINDIDGNTLNPRNTLDVNVGDQAKLNVEICDDCDSSLMQFSWIPLDWPSLWPLMQPTNTQEVYTSAYTLPSMEQRILVQVIDEKGCVSLDTATLRTYATMTFDSIRITDVFVRPPLDLSKPGRDTIIDTIFHKDVEGELLLACNQDIIYLAPRITGGLGTQLFSWSVTDTAGNPIFVEVYNFDQNLVGYIPPSPFGETYDSIMGFRIPSPTVTNAKFTVSVKDEVAKTEQTMSVVVHFRKVPYVKLHSLPRMYDNGYYYGQAVYYELSPQAFVSYDFYRLINTNETGYALQPTNSTNPQYGKSSGNSPVFPTSFVEGEEDNMVVGVVQDEYGCRNSDSIKLKLLPKPNVVIPDDEMYPLNRVFLPDFDIEVHDSWGLKIKDFGTKGWDATYNGKKVRSGTYYYKAKVPTPEGITIISGAVTVLRYNED